MTSVALDLGAFPCLIFVRLNTGLEKLDGFLWSAYKETFGQRLLSFLINVTQYPQWLWRLLQQFEGAATGPLLLADY